MFDDCEVCGSTMSQWRINGMLMLLCANCVNKVEVDTTADDDDDWQI